MKESPRGVPAAAPTPISAVAPRTGRFLHGLKTRPPTGRTGALRSGPSFPVGRGNPSPHPSPAVLRAAKQQGETSAAPPADREAPGARIGWNGDWQPVKESPRGVPAIAPTPISAVAPRTGRFLHGLKTRPPTGRTGALRSGPSFPVGRGNPSPHPSPAALRAAKRQGETFAAPPADREASGARIGWDGH